MSVPAAGAPLEATLGIPRGAPGIVVFAHGSGSSRFSPRNRFVARALEKSGLATLLIDLLTPEEEVERLSDRLQFDIALLTQRLVDIIQWLRLEPATASLDIGVFGASTGAAAALAAAARCPGSVSAVVSRGGRPDLAGEALGDVLAPTLLIVGAEDRVVLELNREAAAKLKAPHAVEIVAAATHLFEEPGALERVAELAVAFFAERFKAAAGQRAQSSV